MKFIDPNYVDPNDASILSTKKVINIGFDSLLRRSKAGVFYESNGDCINCCSFAFKFSVTYRNESIRNSPIVSISEIAYDGDEWYNLIYDNEVNGWCIVRPCFNLYDEHETIMKRAVDRYIDRI